MGSWRKPRVGKESSKTSTGMQQRDAQSGTGESTRNLPSSSRSFQTAITEAADGPRAALCVLPTRAALCKRSLEGDGKLLSAQDKAPDRRWCHGCRSISCQKLNCVTVCGGRGCGARLAAYYDSKRIRNIPVLESNQCCQAAGSTPGVSQHAARWRRTLNNSIEHNGEAD